MTAQTVARNAVEVTSFNAQIGAEVRCGDVRALDTISFTAVHRAFLDNLVLLIRRHEETGHHALYLGRRPYS